QVARNREQKAASVSGEQPHTLLVPHVCPVAQVPQVVTLRATPQLSTTLVSAPQFFPSRAHKAASDSRLQQVLVGVAGAAEHSCPVGQVLLHITTVPQLSATLPQRLVQVVVIELREQPQTLGVTAPHAWLVPVPQIALPQLIAAPPHPLGSVPQLVPLGQLVL